MKRLLLLMLLCLGAKAYAQNPDSLTFAVLGNSISTYYDYLPSGYAIYYSQDREKNYGIQVGDTWWMQLSRLSGLTFLANASWSGSRVAADELNSNAPFLSNHRVKALGRAGNPDLIFIAGGTNDWNVARVPLGEYRTSNFTDSVSFRGAYQRLLYKLTTRYPQARIVCLSIFPRGNGVNDKNAKGWSQADANASIRHIAQQFLRRELHRCRQPAPDPDEVLPPGADHRHQLEIRDLFEIHGVQDRLEPTPVAGGQDRRANHAHPP